MWNDIETFMSEFYEKRKQEVKGDVVKIRNFYEQNKAIIFWIIVCIISLEYLDYGTVMHGIGKYSQTGGQNPLGDLTAKLRDVASDTASKLNGAAPKQGEAGWAAPKTEAGDPKPEEGKKKKGKLHALVKKTKAAVSKSPQYFSKKSAGLKKTLSGKSSFGFLKKKAGQGGQAASAAMGPLSSVADFFSPLTNMISKAFYKIGRAHV